MEDVDDADADGDADADADGDVDGDDGDGDNEDDEGDNEDDEEQDDVESPSQRNRQITSTKSPLPNGVSSASGEAIDTLRNPRVTLTSPSPRTRATFSSSGLPFRPTVRPEALQATLYDIVPTIAAPHSTSINAVTATPDMRWVFSGGADGYIRKFNWVDTANGKLMLTVAQRHPFVDSVTKAGVLMSYWENEDHSGKL